MDFWLLYVRRLITINGKGVPFSYLNIYFDMSKADDEVNILSKCEDVLETTIYHWFLYEDGTQECVEN